MKLTSESKFLLVILLGTVALIAGAIFFFSQPVKPAPSLSREELVPANSYTRGNASASAYLVEFSDFQCPACKAFKPTVDDITKKNSAKLLFVYRHFPLDQHPFAIKAAIAAEAAGKQGKFWEMYDLLFENQEKFSGTLFPDLALQLNLNPVQFEQDVANKDLSGKIDKDRLYGISKGVNSTPTFFLNGVKLTLTSYVDLKNAVQKAL